LTSAVRTSPPLSELSSRQIAWILGGAAMTLATLPGQTVFIAQFNSALRAEFDLSHGAFGGLYTVATLTSATGLVFAGVLADRVRLRRLAAATLLGLAGATLLMSQVGSLPLLVLALACLRFFGQGMMMHIAFTAMARWFNRFRGRAISLAALGFTFGEAMLPFGLTLAIGAFGWRQVWGATGVVLVVVLLPLIAWLLREAPDGARALRASQVNPDAPAEVEASGTGWTRGRVLRDPLFWALVPGVMAPPAIGTLFIFHQAHLAELKGWPLTTFTAFYPVLSVCVVAASLSAGALVDRLSAWRLMPVLLLPLAIACLVVATLEPVWAIPALLLGFGLSQGMMNPVTGALWVELYGSAHVGAIRALVTACLVAASALGPGLAGVLIDAGVELDLQGFGYAGWCLLSSGVYLALQGLLAQRARQIAGA
jgi:sugar phosphate permease